MSSEFNHSIPICLFQARRLRRITQGKFWCILTARYKHSLYRIDLITDDPPDHQPVATDIAPSESHQLVHSIVHADP